MNQEQQLPHDLMVPPTFAYCERILSLYAPGQAPGWWLALQNPDEPLFAPHLRVREVPVDLAGRAAEQAVADGYRPHLFVPRPGDWPAVYDALGRYQDFARLWICGRDDETMTALLHQPSAEMREAQRTDAWLTVPNLEYGKALDQVLDTRLVDFRLDPAITAKTLGPGRLLFQRVSRLNPYRILEVEVDRIAGEATLRQIYLSADPQGPKEPCKLPIAFAAKEQLRFDEGICRLDRSDDEQVNAVCTWLEIPKLVTLEQPLIAPPLKVCQALTKSREKILDGMERMKRLDEFSAWMAAWKNRYFAGTPPLPTGDKSLPWIARALEETIREFDLGPLLHQPEALPLATHRPLRIRGATREDLGKYLGQVAETFAPEG